ncbi:MAG TPA: YHYH protein [Planctomycetes bacterium]|nr:YHYH protein [Verrucomicrobiales bacterium]HIM28378.1 YHYH protein [Planctomycetota bacterium]
MKNSFGAFASKLKTHSDGRYFFVESNGIPDHRMMVGITAWQQQVPIPQPYTGDNAWQIPLHPLKASHPMSAKKNFFRGAIALAANGIPIFNPIKNDGRTDTFTAGELDQWGGHCGRADDYHYHIAPTHLQSIVGKVNPIAFALDGYPIYGFNEPDGSSVSGIDPFNGHTDKNGGYHYHATRTYPYINGGFYGEVSEAGGQVHPQPRAGGVRPASRPLRGARITDFNGSLKDGYRLKYSLNGQGHSINYKVLDNGSVRFHFVDANRQLTEETYEPRHRGDGGERGGRERRSPRGRRQRN